MLTSTPLQVSLMPVPHRSKYSPEFFFSFGLSLSEVNYPGVEQVLAVSIAVVNLTSVSPALSQMTM